MAQMLKIHQTGYKAAFDFLSQVLPTVGKKVPSVWKNFLMNSHLDADEAMQAATMNGAAPLIFASDLGSAIYGQFDPQIPGRIEIGIEVLEKFASDISNASAQLCLRAKVLHEICRWGCFRKAVPDNDESGEAFERAAFGQELLPWWNTIDSSGDEDVFRNPQSRADLLVSLIGKPGFASGCLDDPNHAVFGGVNVAEAMHRGFRNNPGNIRGSPSRVGHRPATITRL